MASISQSTPQARERRASAVTSTTSRTSARPSYGPAPSPWQQSATCCSRCAPTNSPQHGSPQPHCSTLSSPPASSRSSPNPHDKHSRQASPTPGAGKHEWPLCRPGRRVIYGIRSRFTRTSVDIKADTTAGWVSFPGTAKGQFSGTVDTPITSPPARAVGSASRSKSRDC